jgi:hypothetical protein
MQGHGILSLVQRLAAAGKIGASDVIELRRAVFGDGGVTKQEAEALFDLVQKRPDVGEEWREFFVEALTDHIVNQVEPQGYVDEANARWLMNMVSRDNVIGSDTELDLLVKVMEKSVSVPESLELFVLHAVRDAVVTGEGPTRHGPLVAGCISQAETEILRRVLYAAGGSGNVAVTRAEADILFDINDATLNVDNDPAWSDLFVKAIANHVMAVSGYQPAPREDTLRRSKWLDDTEVSVGGFLGRMAGGWREMIAGYVSPQESRSLEALNQAAESITQDEAEWLRERIMRNGSICRNQKALLSFLREETPSIHPALHELLRAA